MVQKQQVICFLAVVILFFRLLPIILNPSYPSYSSNPSTSLQTKLNLTFASYLPNTEAGLLSGVVLGTKKSLPVKLYEQMQQTGTLHIAVASGMNIALMAQPALVFLTLFFKRRIALIPLFILIWFYALLTGFQPPIIRASIMASLLYLAQEFGRKTENIRILLLTGYVMILINPQLIFDLGFQLSFTSMLGLTYLEPALKSSKNIFLRLMASTLACQIATLPIIMVNFGEYNLISPIANLLVLWTIPYILGIGLISAILSFFSRFLSGLLLWLFYPLMWYFVTVIEFTSRIKIFQIWTPKWGWWVSIGYYLVIGWWIISKSKSQSKS